MTHLSAVPARALVFTTSPRAGRSEAGAREVAAALRARGVDVAVARQADLPIVAAGLDAGAYPPAITSLLATAAEADVLCLAGPVHRSRVSGLLRNAVELLRDELEGKPVAVVIGAGSDRAHLAADDLRGDLYLNFRCTPVGALVVTKRLDADETKLRAATLADALIAHTRIPV